MAIDSPFKPSIDAMAALSVELASGQNELDAAVSLVSGRHAFYATGLDLWGPLATYYEGLAGGADNGGGGGGGGGVIVPPAPNSVLGDDGLVDDDKMNALANAYETEAGFAYRFGVASPPISGLMVWSTPPEQNMPVNNRTFSFGIYQEGYTDFSSTDIHIPFIPNDPVRDMGIAGISGLCFDHNVATLRPQPNWTRDRDQQMNAYEAQHWRDNGHPTLSHPIAISRGYGRPGWNTGSHVVFKDGSFCRVGANTMTNRAYGKLPAGKIPLGMAVFSGDEFILIPCWDVNAKKAEVAMIITVGLSHMGTIEVPVPPQQTEPWWNEPKEVQPGMYNLGNTSWYKYLGCFSLGTMKCPTGISTTCGFHTGAYMQSDPNKNPWNNWNWEADEAQRQRFCRPNGDLAGNVVRQGAIMVWSKEEKRVDFFDVKPFFDYLDSWYFNTRARYLQTRDIGDAPNQWPFSFDVAPEQKPVFIKSIALPARPTAGRLFDVAYESQYRQAWIALENETMWTISMGGYAEPADTNPPAGKQGNPANLVKVGETPIPKNVTCITQARLRGNAQIREWTRALFLVSREEKSVRLYDMVTANGAGVLKWKLQDAKWIDPIWGEDLENHGTESYIFSVADFEGGCVWNDGYGPITLHTQGNTVYPMIDGEKFNNFGKYQVRGKPFWVGGPNVS